MSLEHPSSFLRPAADALRRTVGDPAVYEDAATGGRPRLWISHWIRHAVGSLSPAQLHYWRATVPLFHACRRHYPGGASRCARRSLPSRWQPSPLFGRVGLRVARFEACSTFTRVAARMVAEPPQGRPVASKCFSRSRYLLPPPRLLPAGATVAGRVSKPAEGQRLPRRTE